MYRHDTHQDLHSFPTRRSSDLQMQDVGREMKITAKSRGRDGMAGPGESAEKRRREQHRNMPRRARYAREPQDRKSTRLNSSHPSISYAVFCLKKKKRN